MNTHSLKVRRAERWPYLWGSLVMVLVIAVAGISIAYFHASAAASTAQAATRRAEAASQRAQAASRKAQAVSQCINDVLAARDKLNQADHANERRKILDQQRATKDWTEGLAALAVAKNAKDGIIAYRQFQKGSTEFARALAGWLARDAAIKADRQKHPLGRC